MNISGNFSTDEIRSNNVLSPLLAYINLAIIVLGLVGNSLCFFIFRCSSSFRNMPSMVYLSFVAVFDTLALFEWNLNHYTSSIFDIEISSISIPICRIYTFMQYTSLQASALIMSAMCIDRYITVASLPGSFLYRLPFRTNRTAFIWSTAIVLFTILLNSQILFSLGIYIESGSNSTDLKVDCRKYSYGFDSNIWDQVNILFLDLVPFLVMITFNLLLIINIKKTNINHSQNRKSEVKKRNLTITLLFVSFLFLVITVPSNILFAYFYDLVLSTLSLQFIYIVDDIFFLNNCNLFFVCFLSNPKFRKSITSLRYLQSKLMITNTS